MLGIRRLILNLHAQAADIDIYDFFLSQIRAAPNTVQDIRPVQRLSLIHISPQKERLPQQPEFVWHSKMIRIPLGERMGRFVRTAQQEHLRSFTVSILSLIHI